MIKLDLRLTARWALILLVGAVRCIASFTEQPGGSLMRHYPYIFHLRRMIREVLRGTWDSTFLSRTQASLLSIWHFERRDRRVIFNHQKIWTIVALSTELHGVLWTQSFETQSGAGVCVVTSMFFSLFQRVTRNHSVRPRLWAKSLRRPISKAKREKLRKSGAGMVKKYQNAKGEWKLF